MNFYPNSSLKLKKWTKYLSAICILTSLEDDYSIIQEAGQGSSARVYLAHERITQKKFAVKTINKDNFLINKRALPALMNEIEIMRALSHPRLLKLHKIYEDEDMIHLVLDWMDNGDLYERVTRRGCFTEENSQLFSKNLLEAIEYLHSKNIIHRDLKPENILMTDPKNDTEFKIADFGLAAFSTSELTLRCGSPGYAAPELLKKKPYGPKVDIFSIGVISYVLLSGRAPFYGRNIQEILVNNRDCNINFYEKHWKNISLDAVNLIIKMTEKDPNNRYSATEALAHP